MSGWMRWRKEGVGGVAMGQSSTHADLSRQFVYQYVGRRMPPELSPTLSISDVVQSVLVLALRNGHKFRGRTDSEYQGWLARISERKIIDALRRYRTRRCPQKLRPQFDPSVDQREDRRSPDYWLCKTEDHYRLSQAIESLPDNLRLIVMERYRVGLTFEQISKKHRIPTTTCRRRWFKGLQALSRLMDVSGKGMSS